MRWILCVLLVSDGSVEFIITQEVTSKVEGLIKGMNYSQSRIIIMGGNGVGHSLEMSKGCGVE